MPARATESQVVQTLPALTSREQDRLTQRIIACAIEVHRALGPGLLESAYDRCLAHEFSIAGMPFTQQLPVALQYKGLAVASAYRIDFLVAEAVIVEVKSVERLCIAHSAQLQTYLKFLQAPAGLLINFNVAQLVHGVRRLRR